MNDIVKSEAHTPALQETRTMMQIIEDAAKNPAVDVSKMQALLQLQRELLKDSAEEAFNQAYARLQLVLPRVKKDGAVEYAVDKNRPDGLKKKAFNFAKWETMDEVIRPLLQAENFSLTFTSEPRADGGGLIVTGILMHVAGHTRKASIPLALDSSGGKNNLQGMGSTFSYGKRYTTTMLLNIVTEDEDDDGIRGGMQFITEGQIAHIKSLVTETKTNPDGFLETIGHTTYENIHSSEYTMVVNILTAKKRQQAEKSKTA